MVVICPKCKVRLNVDEKKLAPEGSRFKCPKCSAVLVVKRPVSQTKKTPTNNKILVAHSNPGIIERTSSVLSAQGYMVITAADGIEAMVKALNEYPFLSIIEVALPKIYGFELCKRLKSRAETKQMKFILIASIYDKAKYRRDPVSLYGADEYIEEHELPAQLIDKINKLSGLRKEETPETPVQPVPKMPETMQPEPRVEQAVKETPLPPDKGPSDERIEKAKRLARTIINDIYLYNSAKTEEAIRNNNFYSVFASEVKEGQKLYDNRIPQEIRNIDNFYKEAIENFIAAKKKSLT